MISIRSRVFDILGRIP